MTFTGNVVHPEIMSDGRGGRGGRRILLVRLGAVGDVVRTLPLLHAMRAEHPTATLGWLVEEPSVALLERIAALDAVHVLRRRAVAAKLSRPWGWPGAVRILRDLRRELLRARYDLVLDVHGTLKAALAATLAGGRLVGFAPGGSKEGAHLLHDVSHPFTGLPVPRVLRALMLGAEEGLLGPDPPIGAGNEGRIDFGLREPHERGAAIRRFLAADRRPVVVLFPFASKGGQAKRWPIERHVELGGRLAAAGHRVILAWGSPREEAEARAAAAASPAVEVAPPTDLVELAELLRGAALLVTGDTGPMHLAAAVGTRVLALFGPTDPVVNRPWGEGHEVIVHRPLAGLPVAAVETRARAMLRGGGA